MLIGGAGGLGLLFGGYAIIAGDAARISISPALGVVLFAVGVIFAVVVVAMLRRARPAYAAANLVGAVIGVGGILLIGVIAAGGLIVSALGFASVWALSRPDAKAWFRVR